jgi:hypothetical protein
MVRLRVQLRFASRSTRSRDQAGRRLVRVDPPRKPGFVPGNLRSRRHWMFAFLAVVFGLFWLPWVSLNGWVASFLVTLIVFAVWTGLSWANSVIARKVDPWKGTAPGDRVGPISPPAADVKHGSPPLPPA